MPEALTILDDFLTGEAENHFENEFQFQLQGYSSPANPVNPLPHNRM
jgi:hypothetical protein